MRSRAQIKGHPIHPILVAFPIAFLCGSLIFDLAGYLANWSSGWTTGAWLNLGAIITGLGAGVPGLVDYFAVVPPRSSAKSRATWHLAVNVSALVLFAISWIFRDWTTLRPNLLVLILEGLGVALVTWGGYMGGTLVYRNQIGVDHRYAGAGKWRERTVQEGTGESVVVARVDDLKTGQMMLVHAGERRIVLARTEKGFVAFDDRCTHRGGPLADGVLSCDTVTCPWHGSQFNVQNGSVVSGPAKEAISTYEVNTAGDEVRLVLPVGLSKK